MNDIILNNPVWCGVSRSRKEDKKKESGRKGGKKRRKKEGKETSSPPLWYLSKTGIHAGVGIAFSKTDQLITSSVLYPIHTLIVFLVLVLIPAFLFISKTHFFKGPP